MNINYRICSMRRRSRIVAAPPDVLSEIITALEYIRVAHAHVNNLVSRIARVYAISTRTHAVQRSSANKRRSRIEAAQICAMK